MNWIDVTAYKKYLMSLKKNLPKHQLPLKLIKLLVDHNVNEIQNVDERAKKVIQILCSQKIYSSTVVKYYNILKKTLLKGTTIKPNLLIFSDLSQPHQKVPNFGTFNILIDFLLKNKTNKKYIPLLFCYYTGLRRNEVVKLTNFHLQQLLKGEQNVTLYRKNNTIWSVIYYPEFVSFINQVYEIYKNEIDYQKHEILLFNISPQTLHVTFTNIYINLIKEKPPLGFGVHWFRYYTATKLTENGNISIARAFLNHKHLSTTEKYVKVDNLNFEKKIEEINNVSLFYKSLLTQIPSNEPITLF